MDLKELGFDLPEVDILKIEKDKFDNILIKLRTTEDHTNCRICKKKIHKRHGSNRELKIKHMPVFGNDTFIIYSPNRYICDDCENNPTTTWHKPNSNYSIEYEHTP